MQVDCYYIKSMFINKLFNCYWLGNLVESDGSNSDSEMNIISEDKSDEDDHDRATVDNFEWVRGQLGSNVAENAISYKLSQLSKWNSTNISMFMHTTIVQNFNLIWCAFVIEMY